MFAQSFMQLHARNLQMHNLTLNRTKKYIPFPFICKLKTFHLADKQWKVILKKSNYKNAHIKVFPSGFLIKYCSV